MLILKREQKITKDNNGMYVGDAYVHDTVAFNCHRMNVFLSQ